MLGGVGGQSASLIIFALSLSWAWLALGLLLRSPSAVMSIGFVIPMPLAFMSNIFVDVNTLPAGADVHRNQPDHTCGHRRARVNPRPGGGRPGRLGAPCHCRANADLYATDVDLQRRRA